jgi:endonuclease YncB( thermonuclease family)
MRKYIFLYVFFLSFFLSGRLPLAHEWYSVERVNDGDTILLEDGRKDLGKHENIPVRSRFIGT